MLADELGISITPLREAIRRLSGQGLIVLEGHRNARVAKMNAEEARELFETRVHAGQGGAGATYVRS